MIDTDEITRRLDRLEAAQAQNFELLNMRLEHIEKKLDMLAEQISWMTKVLSRRFAGMPEGEK